MPPRPRYGEPGFRPRLLRSLRGKGGRVRGGKFVLCQRHHADEEIAEGPPPKAPADLERPSYWREVVGNIYDSGRQVGNVVGTGPRLQCEYHGSQHVTFALDEMCGDCIDADEEDSEDYSDNDHRCRRCDAEDDEPDDTTEDH